MASKKKQADDAYERGEDQRALVTVLHAAGMFASQVNDDEGKLAHAIARVRARFLTVSAPTTPEPSLPGQMNLLDGAIETCPKCGYPDPWSAMMRRSDHTRWWLQCRKCAFVVDVSEAVWQSVIERRRREHQHTDTFNSPVIAEKKGKARGAG